MTPTATNHELIAQTAAALNERAAFIVEHSDTIGVRIELDGRAQSLFLSEMPPDVAIREAFRLLLRAEVPHRRATPRRQGDADPAAGDG